MPSPISTYTPELGQAICGLLEDGRSLLSVCADLKLNESTVRKWARDIPEFSANYARAREIGDDVEFDRLDAVYDEQPRLTPQGFIDPGWVAWKRDQANTKKWQLARKRPKKFGDKLQHTGDGEGPIQFVVTRSGRKD